MEHIDLERMEEVLAELDVVSEFNTVFFYMGGCCFRWINNAPGLESGTYLVTRKGVFYSPTHEPPLNLVEALGLGDIKDFIDEPSKDWVIETLRNYLSSSLVLRIEPQKNDGNKIEKGKLAVEFSHKATRWDSFENAPFPLIPSPLIILHFCRDIAPIFGASMLSAPGLGARAFIGFPSERGLVSIYFI